MREFLKKYNRVFYVAGTALIALASYGLGTGTLQDVLAAILRAVAGA